MNTIFIWQESLLYLTLKSSVLLGGVLMAGLVLYRLSSARRYWLWLSTVVALLLMAVTLPLLPDWRVLPAPAWEAERLTPKVFSLVDQDEPVETGKRMPAIQVSPVQAIAKVGASTPGGQSVLVSAPGVGWSFMGLLPWLWLGGVGLMLLRVGLSVWQLRQVERRVRVANAEELARLSVQPREIAKQVGLSRLPCLLLGPVESVPMVWGLWRTRLLLPEDCYSWPADKLRAVLLHEFEHLRRGDPLALVAGQLMHALHWFNPLAWLMVRRLRADQEYACDDSALTRGVRASDYAQHLLDLSRHTRLAPGLSLCALAMARCAPVEGRVHAILDKRRPRQASSRLWSRLWLGVMLVVALPLAMLQALEVSGFRGQILDRHGEVLAKSEGLTDRQYPLKEKTSHVLGYTRQWVEVRQNNQAHQQGVDGLEKLYDEQLRKGENIRLTLDSRMQKVALHVLAEAGVSRGAVVMMDPRNGDVLAMVSVPSYDPEVFIPKISPEDWQRLVRDESTPILNRAVNPQIPGLAFTPVTAMGLLAEKPDETLYLCNGSVAYGDRLMRCRAFDRQPTGMVHGLTDLTQAFVNGCHCYWYQAGNAAGVDMLGKMGHLLGLNQRHLQLDDEPEGHLPNREWLAKQGQKKHEMDRSTAGIAIGQGAVMTSPLQLTVMASALANGGRVPKPRLIQDDSAPVWTANLLEAGVSAAGMNQAREGLRLAVQSATGVDHAAHSRLFSIAGNEGVSAFYRKVKDRRVKDLNRFFVGFAPYENPTLAFTILTMDDAENSQPCQPLAKRLVEMVLGNEKVPANTAKPNEKSDHSEAAIPAQKPVSLESEALSPVASVN
jgi:hypothetical protein